MSNWCNYTHGKAFSCITTDAHVMCHCTQKKVSLYSSNLVWYFQKYACLILFVWCPGSQNINMKDGLTWGALLFRGLVQRHVEVWNGCSGFNEMVLSWVSPTESFEKAQDDWITWFHWFPRQHWRINLWPFILLHHQTGPVLQLWH